MAQYIKINSKVFNADTFISAIPGDVLGTTSDVTIFTTSTIFETFQFGTQSYWQITTGGADQANALILAINAALTANPGGRVVEVPPSSDYTISSIVYVKGM